MAKVHAPLMSIDASGAWAKSLVYARWKGIRYVRNYVIPANPRTSDQINVRNAFMTAVDQWHQENQTTKDAWKTYVESLGKPESAFNAYVGAVVQYAKGHSWQLPATPFLPGSEE